MPDDEILELKDQINEMKIEIEDLKNSNKLYKDLNEKEYEKMQGQQQQIRKLESIKAEMSRHLRNLTE